MKLRLILLHQALILARLSAYGQGTFIYDQQSNTNEFVPFYGQGETMQQIPPPWGQSFTPSLASVGFIRLKFDDGDTGDGTGATVYLNLRSGSISGPILDSTAPVRMPSLFRGVTNFFFANPVPVTPGVLYYFEPVVQAGLGNGLWNIDVSSFNYPGGMFFFGGGNPQEGTDLWFREGIVVPEPSERLLILVGSGVYVCARRLRIKERSS